MFKNKGIKALLIFMFLFTSVLVSETKAYAETPINYEDIYNQGVEENYINPDTVSLEDWLIENIEYRRSYDEGIAAGVLESSFDYKEWIKANCYGQPPVVDSEVLEEVKIYPRAYVGDFDIQRGDVIITSGTSSLGIVGHAAIANDNTSILDIPRPGKTTRSIPQKDWVKEYVAKGWVRVYRMKDQSLAKSAARWADFNYYSTTGSTIQNIRPTYNINSDLYTTNPTYCSKIVFQAYWFGTGSAPVMKSTKGFVTPYGLIDRFNDAYKPSLVKTYYHLSNIS